MEFAGENNSCESDNRAEKRLLKQPRKTNRITKVSGLATDLLRFHRINIPVNMLRSQSSNYQPAVRLYMPYRFKSSILIGNFAHIRKSKRPWMTAEIAYIFFGLVDNDVILNPDPKELDVKESKFYTKEELIKILANRKTVAYAKSTWNELLKSDINTLFKTDVKKSKQRNEIALFIGRFQPLHHGHVHVLKDILKFHDKIKIGIGSSQLSNTKNDPFTSKERRQFIDAVLKKRNITSKQYEIVDIPDIFDAQNWVKHVVSTVGEFKVIYSNSDWVRNLFLKNGFTLGRKLEIFKKKYNGTNVRKSISKDNKNWTKLVPKEVVNLMRDFKGIERIKHLYKSEEN